MFATTPSLRSNRGRVVWSALGAVAAALAVLALTPPSAQAAPVPAPAASAAVAAIPAYKHVVLAIFENHSDQEVIGSPNAPYLTSLAGQGADFTNAFAIEHPSQPNYLDLFSGSNQGVTDDSCPHTFATDNVGHQLINAGKTFAGYAEDLPAAGSAVCTTATYARKHVPWTNFSDLDQNQVDLPYTSFPSDFATLPTYSWVVPNLCDDMHDCSVATGDTWAQNHLDAYAQWAKTHNSLLIVTFDEDDHSQNNQIATFFVGAHVKPGNYSEQIDHFTVLRTIEDMYGLAPLGSAANRTAITDVFANTITVTNPGAQTGRVHQPITALQIHASDTDPNQTLRYRASGLPTGLSINASTGVITGEPLQTGRFVVTVTVRDATGAHGSTKFVWRIS